MANLHNNDDLDRDLPELSGALKEIYGRGQRLDRDVDERVLGAARRRFAHQRRVRMAWRTIAAVGAAAVIGLAAWLGPWGVNQPGPSSPQLARALTIDFNGDGDEDILDAFLIASRIRDGEALSKSWDVNRDGAVTLDDADAVAIAAVSLARHGAIQ